MDDAVWNPAVFPESRLAAEQRDGQRSFAEVNRLASLNILLAWRAVMHVKIYSPASILRISSSNIKRTTAGMVCVALQPR